MQLSLRQLFFFFVNGNNKQLTMREMQAKIILRDAAITLVIALIVGTIGPFGTFVELTLLDRYLYWIAIVFLNWAQILLVILLLNKADWTENWSQWAIIAAGCVIASLPATFEVYWLEAVFRPTMGLQSMVIWELYFYVLLLSLVIGIPAFSVGQIAEKKRKDDEVVIEQSQPSSFLQRIPIALGQELCCLKAEDHYLRVYTSEGNDLILYRLSDAATELGDQAGAQVHRSYWVAKDAVNRVSGSGQNTILHLKNSLEVPVSRTYLPKLKAAGWFS
jgi:LytTr DNA-binding domain